MDITMKKYEHRYLAMSVCEHKCNVGEKYVLPQAQAFGLSQSMATAGLADIHNNNCCDEEEQLGSYCDEEDDSDCHWLTVISGSQE